MFLFFLNPTTFSFLYLHIPILKEPIHSLALMKTSHAIYNDEIETYRADLKLVLVNKFGFLVFFQIFSFLCI